YVDTVNNLLEFKPGVTSGDPVKMSAITLGSAPWKDYAENIEHIIVRDGIFNIADGAGAGLPKLKDITIGKDVAEIEPRAFINSPAVSQFTVDENNKTFRTIDSKHILVRKDTVDGKSFFSIVRACVGSLTTYTVPESIDSSGKEHIHAICDYAFYGASKLARLKLNSTLISIGEYAFSGCAIKGDPSANDAIRVLTIPDSVRIIGAYAFEGNLFNTTSFSYNLNTIGENAFANCEALTEITAINNPVMLVERNAFFKTNLSKGTTPISFNGSSDEWREVAKNDSTLSTLSSIRYASINPHNTEYIAYDINGGSVFTIPENQNYVKKDTNLNLTGIDPIKNEDANGYSVYPLHPTKYFAGWSTEKLEQVMLDTSLYQPGDTFDVETVKKRPSVRLYAAWTDEINLVFNANGGTLTKGLESVKKDQPVNSYKLPKAVPTHKKYNFVGWSKDKDAKTADYQPEDTIKLNKNTILYAVWNTEGPYDVIIDAAGGKLSDGNSKKVLAGVKTKGTDYTVSEANPTRDRYEFKGWSV
ncbi:MAG: leucine-rich repeat protein, partial [Clostridia bacterium]|nr:leucine-rich repeat protein [Clostridia bacterium]